MKDREWTLIPKDDIGFAIRLAHGEGFPEGWADFEIYEIVGWPHGPKPGDPARFFAERGAMSSVDMVPAIEDAELFASGSVKWDGCLELDLKDRHHMCGRRGGEAFGKMLVAIWDEASKFLPAWDHSVADTTPQKGTAP